MGKLKVKKYTNSVQHNVIATIIDEINQRGCLKLIDENLIGTDKSILLKEHSYKLYGLLSSYDFINILHELGYKIVKGK